MEGKRRNILLVASVLLAVLLAIGLTLPIRTESARAAFPGTNGKIVFVEQDNTQSDSGMKLISPNGSGLVTLVDNASGSALLRDPSISPDGMRVAYARGGSTNGEIYKINIANRRVTRITNNEVYDGNPAWSPDGTRVAFEGERNPAGSTGTDILIRRADGTGRTVNLTETPSDDEFAPAWSPNGREIAFYTGFRRDICVLNLQTGQRRSLTNDGALDKRPNWSPDGARIVLEREVSEPPNYRLRSDSIYTMNASDGSDKQLLAKVFHNGVGNGASFGGTTYSPDGKQIAYVQIEKERFHTDPALYTMNSSDGSDKHMIYGAGGGDHVLLSPPDWGVQVQR